MFGCSRPLILGAWLIGSGTLAVAPCSAQVSQPDSSAAAKPDSAAVLRPDSTPLAPDSVRKTQGAETPAPSPPADSTLAAACSSFTDASPAIAAGLLVVVFAPATKPKERAAVAKAVGGTLVSPVGSGGVGAYYLRVPSRSDHESHAIADQVIRLPGVLQVGTKTCPPASARSGNPPTPGRS
jgi:hypothetical protein